jgi:hypothetical protein
MRCYFLHGSQLAGVDMLPPGLSDLDALARSETQSLKRRGPIDGLEVWDRARLIFRRMASSADAAATLARLAAI